MLLLVLLTIKVLLNCLTMKIDVDCFCFYYNCFVYYDQNNLSICLNLTYTKYFYVMRNCNFLYISNVPFLYVGNSYIQVGAFLKKITD